MKYILEKSILLLGITLYSSLSAVSVVYNFRVALVTKRAIFEDEDENRKNTVIGLIFDQYRKKYCGNIKQRFVGESSTYIRDFKPYYFRTDFAFAGIKEKVCNQTGFSGIETDDILFTLGRNFKIKKKSKITLSGLFGVPTHKIYRLQHVDFGYNQIGLGTQIDGLYAYNKNNFFLWGARYIYFIPRNAYDNYCNKYKFTLGNLGDIIFANKHDFNNHSIEYGYSHRWRFGCKIEPNLDNTVIKTNYSRNSVYFVYQYQFLINNVNNQIFFDIGYSNEPSPKIYGNKYIVMIWTSWNVSF